MCGGLWAFCCGVEIIRQIGLANRTSILTMYRRLGRVGGGSILRFSPSVYTLYTYTIYIYIYIHICCVRVCLHAMLIYVYIYIYVYIDPLMLRQELEEWLEVGPLHSKTHIWSAETMLSYLQFFGEELRERRRRLGLTLEDRALLICDSACQHSSKKFVILKDAWAKQFNVAPSLLEWAWLLLSSWYLLSFF